MENITNYLYRLGERIDAFSGPFRIISNLRWICGPTGNLKKKYNFDYYFGVTQKLPILKSHTPRCSC